WNPTSLQLSAMRPSTWCPCRRLTTSPLSARQPEGHEMALVPFVEREQIVDGQPYDTAKKVVGQVLNFHKVVAHSPRALEGSVTLSVALKEMKLDRRLRELAYLRTAQLNHCEY